MVLVNMMLAYMILVQKKLHKLTTIIYKMKFIIKKRNKTLGAIRRDS